VLVILFSWQRTLPELLHLMWALLPVKPTAPGFADEVFLILARFTPSHLCLPYFKAFGFLPSYLPWAHGAIPQM
jgi:hypothetical protein